MTIIAFIVSAVLYQGMLPTIFANQAPIEIISRLKYLNAAGLHCSKLAQSNPYLLTESCSLVDRRTHLHETIDIDMWRWKLVDMTLRSGHNLP